MPERIIELLTQREAGGYLLPFFLSTLEGRKVNWQWLVEVAIVVGVLWGTTKTTLDRIHDDVESINSKLVVIEEHSNKNHILISTHIAEDMESKKNIASRLDRLERNGEK